MDCVAIRSLLLSDFGEASWRRHIDKRAVEKITKRVNIQNDRLRFP